MALLDVGDGQRIYWERHGDPDGIPVVHLHGGPGGGGGRGGRTMFDRNVFHTVLFDQRGCGGSVPNVADPAVSLEHNTTWHLVDDIERLRREIGVEKWLVYGISWGATLALAYAQRHPDRVTGLLLAAVTTTTPREIDWLYHGAGRLFPDAWDAFRAGAGGDADTAVELLDAYGRLVASPDPQVREAAARDWCAWEDALIAHEDAGLPGSYSVRTGPVRIAFVRLCAHYFGHLAWLRDGQLLDDIDRIGTLPGRLIHGRGDLSCPPQIAADLAEAWPAARLTLVDDAGHTGSTAFAKAIDEAVDDFRRLLG